MTDKQADDKSELRGKYLDSLTKEIKALRDWLDYLEKDLTHEKGVIPAILLTSIGESCTKLIYEAAVINGSVLRDSEL